MKNIKQIREEKDKIAPTSDEERKLTQLVRAGLFDAKKLAVLKRALRKENIQMTRQERDTLLQLLDVLLDMITGNRQLFSKVKQTVSEEKDEEFSMARGDIKSIMNSARIILDKLQGEGELEAWVQSKITKAEDYLSAVADRLQSGEALEEARLSPTVRDINDLPNIIVLRRRSVRVFPEGYKVVMYWADKINRYIPIPVDPYVMTRGLDLNEARTPDQIKADQIRMKDKNMARRKLVYMKRREKIGSLEDDDPESAVQSSKAAKTIKRIGSNYGDTEKIRTSAVGRNTERDARKKKIYRAGFKAGGEHGYLNAAKGMASSGNIAAALGTVAGGAIGSISRKIGGTLAKRLVKEGIETSRIKMKKMSVSPLTGVKKIPSSNAMIREKFQNKLTENKELDENLVTTVIGKTIQYGSKYADDAAKAITKYGDDAAKSVSDKVSKFKAGREVAKAEKLAKVTKRRQAVDRLKSIRDKNKNAFRKKSNKSEKLGKLAGLGAGGAELASSPSTGSASADKSYQTQRREVGRLERQDPFKTNLRQGDYATRATLDAKRQRAAFATESTIKTLKSINEGAEKTLTFNDGSQIDVNHFLAQKIINIYESINKNNKQLMANMLNESVESFKKVSNFAISNRK